MRPAAALLLLASVALAFRCQQVAPLFFLSMILDRPAHLLPHPSQVIDTYNLHVNTGNFTGAAALTFTDTVRYIIPGTAPECPYCGVYNGKDQVISLFVNGFLGAHPGSLSSSIRKLHSTSSSTCLLSGVQAGSL